MSAANLYAEYHDWPTLPVWRDRPYSGITHQAKSEYARSKAS